MASFEVSFKYPEVFLIYPEKTLAANPPEPVKTTQDTAFPLTRTQHSQTVQNPKATHLPLTKTALNSVFSLLFSKPVGHHCSKQSVFQGCYRKTRPSQESIPGLWHKWLSLRIGSKVRNKKMCSESRATYGKLSSCDCLLEVLVQSSSPI